MLNDPETVDGQRARARSRHPTPVVKGVIAALIITTQKPLKNKAFLLFLTLSSVDF